MKCYDQVDFISESSLDLMLEKQCNVSGDIIKRRKLLIF